MLKNKDIDGSRLDTMWVERLWSDILLQSGEKNPTKILGSSISVKYLGFQGFGGCQDIPSKVMAKLLHLAPPTTKKEAQHVVGLLRFWKQRNPHLGVLQQLIYWVAWKLASSEWSPGQEKALHQVQAAVQVALPREPEDPADAKVLEASVQTRMMFGALGKPP